MRFPEFEGEWEEKRLGEVAEIVGGGTPDTTIEEYWNGNIQWFTPSEIKASYVSKSERTITELGVQKSSAKLLPIGAILLTTRATIGETAITKNICTTNQGFQSLIVNKQSNNIFIANWIKRNTKELVKRSNGSTFLEINKSEIEKIPISIPSKVEQNKIAIFLSLIDERIEAQRKIIEGYESLIKGLSEKLFSQQIRFKNKNGNKYSDWRIKMLEEIGESFNGLSGKNKDDFGEGKLYIQYKQIFSGSTINVNECGLVNIYNGENQSKVQYGDVFFTVSSETPDEIGMSSVLIDEVDEMYLNSFCFGVRPSSLNLVNPLYMSFLLRASIFRSKVIKLAQGSTRYNLSKVALMKLAIPLPLMEEQKQIAQFLLSIGTKIRVESSILEKYQSQKMYILQNLFI